MVVNDLLLIGRQRGVGGGSAEQVLGFRFGSFDVIDGDGAADDNAGSGGGGGNMVYVADPDTYVHRMGRCGRFGRHGTAISFLESTHDESLLLDIERHFHVNHCNINTNNGSSNNHPPRMTEEWDPNEIEKLADRLGASLWKLTKAENPVVKDFF